MRGCCFVCHFVSFKVIIESISVQSFDFTVKACESTHKLYINVLEEVHIFSPVFECKKIKLQKWHMCFDSLQSIAHSMCVQSINVLTDRRNALVIGSLKGCNKLQLLSTSNSNDEQQRRNEWILRHLVLGTASRPDKLLCAGSGTVAQDGASPRRICESSFLLF